MIGMAHTIEEARDEANVVHVATLSGAQVMLNKKDEYVLLQLRTFHDEDVWVRLTRENFIGLAQYLSDEAQRIKGH